MLEKGFIRNRMKTERKVNRFVSAVGTLLFFIGLVIVIATLIYMIINFSSASSILTIWLPVLVSGIIMVFIGQTLKKQNSGPRR